MTRAGLYGRVGVHGGRIRIMSRKFWQIMLANGLASSILLTKISVDEFHAVIALTHLIPQEVTPFYFGMIKGVVSTLFVYAFTGWSAYKALAPAPRASV